MDIIISNRVRLARNLKKYSFPSKLSASAANEMIEDVKKSILETPTIMANQFEFMNMEKKEPLDKLVMMEKHLISPEFVKKTTVPTGLLLKQDETVSIMINEEDHLRIQAIRQGEDIHKTWELTSRIDDLLEETLEYAFHEKYGYLTACPTNLGTGLRASYMIHVPALEVTGQLKVILQAIGKFGITIRGMYGEGTEAQGSLFQISNQITLGQSEQEIMENLNTVTQHIVEQERRLREVMLQQNRLAFEDRVFRSYGILTHARQLTSKEAMRLLSDIKVGFELEILKAQQMPVNIYDLMVCTQPANLQRKIGKTIQGEERDVERARFLRKYLPKLMTTNE
ncbi:MAG: protein arginine kinase [Epulopiscium sp.]|nr:protein arginine kinase [Candidatus Epulonipiscium sp.]